MNKAELVVKVSEKCGVTKKEAEELLTVAFDEVVKTLKSGEEVKVANFGVFTVKNRSARKGTIPGTTKEIKIPARKVITFKASKGVKELIK